MTELARRLGLHKSTASRLLATLERRGLVEQDEESGKYRLGLVVIRLAERAERTLDLKGIALPELERLARATRETVTLAILEGDACLTVAQVDGPNMVACPDWTGRTTPLHCVASGKVLLAAMAERDVLRIAAPGPGRPDGADDHAVSSPCWKSWPASAGAATPPRSPSGSRARTGSPSPSSMPGPGWSPRSPSGAPRSGSRRRARRRS